MNLFRKTLVAVTAVAAIASAAAPALADRYSRDFQLMNYSGYGITAVYASHVDEPYWGPNLLSYALYSGNAAWTAPAWDDGYCLFDLRIEYADGYVTELWAVNLCEEHFIVADPTSAFVA